MNSAVSGRLQGMTDDLPRIGAPARRALAGIGITQLAQVGDLTEAQLSALHGIGPRAIGLLRQALDERGLSFRSTSG